MSIRSKTDGTSSPFSTPSAGGDVMFREMEIDIMNDAFLLQWLTYFSPAHCNFFTLVAYLGYDGDEELTRMA